jgi:hypothetical protein
MMRLFPLILLAAACTHLQAGGALRARDVAVDRVSAEVGGRTYHAVALSLFHGPASTLWYSILSVDGPSGSEGSVEGHVKRLKFASDGTRVVAFQTLHSALFVFPDNLPAASAEAARAELLGTVAPKWIASNYPAVPVVVPDLSHTIHILDAVGYDFRDRTFHETYQIEIISAGFTDGAWQLELRNRHGEQRTLRLDRNFQPIRREGTR